MQNYPLPLSSFNFSTDSTSETVTKTFGVKVQSVENSIALEDDANYNLRLNLASQPEDSSFRYTNRDLRLSIADPDSKLIIILFVVKYNFLSAIH